MHSGSLLLCIFVVCAVGLAVTAALLICCALTSHFRVIHSRTAVSALHERFVVSNALRGISCASLVQGNTPQLRDSAVH